MLVRYLAIPFGVCMAFAPIREIPSILCHRSKGRYEPYIDTGRERFSVFLAFSDSHSISRSEKDNQCSDSDNISLAETAPGTSRRQAFILSGAAATASVVARRTDASIIPTAGPWLEENVHDDASDEIILGDSDLRLNNISRNVAEQKSYEQLLDSSILYRVQTKSYMPPTAKVKTDKITPVPSVNKVTKERLLRVLQSKRAILLGEHHPEGRDHRLQAALIRSLYNGIHSATESTFSNTKATKLVVGLEAVQRKFQPILDQYCQGVIDEEELRRRTEWESRWYWSFEAYKPIFQTSRELGIGLLALDIATEDRLLVEQRGLEALDRDTLREYIPDIESFSAFGNSQAYRSFVSYTLRPPYELQQRTKKQQKSKSISFSNFVARQMLRDEGMASAANGWLSRNPSGILVACIGINHATFGCGVQGRLEQKLSSKTTLEETRNDVNKNYQRVASILINPEPLNTGTELKLCQGEGRAPVDDDDDDDDEYTIASQIFVPNIRNEICIENSVEVQNYALQLQYVSAAGNIQGRRAVMEEATQNLQAKQGETVLGLSDYLMFSPKPTTT